MFRGIYDIHTQRCMHGSKTQFLDKLVMRMLSTHPYDASLGLHDGLGHLQ